jgi:uncharacterized integral membrane protein (TIGR00697 family)
MPPHALRPYLLLGSLFVASLVSCNLIFRKFFLLDIDVLGLSFAQSVGLLPYPLTFVITDVLSEIYGRKRANLVVTAGLFASGFTLLIISLAQWAPAAPWSPVTDNDFNHVFGQTILAVGASMFAYLLAQYLDVRIFHFWKTLTHGKHLWLRNNLSTIPSQFVDTLAVLTVLCWAGEIPWDLFPALFWNGFLFKVLFALLDTPFVYAATWWLRRRLGLRFGEEIPD